MADPRNDASGSSTLFLVGFFVLMASPGIAWIALDRHAFGGDQSQYAAEAVTLFDTLLHSTSEWPSAMARSIAFKAPGIAWLGQVFVPLGQALGSIDSGLLLLIAGAQFLALVLTYRSIRALAGGAAGAALLGCLVIASAPLAVQLGHEFLVETVQTLATAYFILIMVFAPRWDRAQVLAHLLLATALALLTKATSPLYCFAPGLLALGWALAPARPKRPWAWSRPSTLAPLAAGAVVAFGAVVWYLQNLAAVRIHAAGASSGPIALYWGKDEPFFETLVYWAGALGAAFFLRPIAVLAVGAFVAAALVWARRRPLRRDHFTACAAVAVLEIAVVLSVFSANQSRVARFLLPVLPYLALLLAWTFAQLPIAAGRLALLVFAAQFVVVQGHAFRWVKAPFLAAWIRPIDTRGASRSVLEAVVDRTCSVPRARPYLVIIGVDPSIMGDWLAPVPANYVLAKRRLLTRRPSLCHYDYLGGGFFGGTASEVWSDMLARRARYFVTVDERVYPVPGMVYNRGLDAENFPVLLQHVRESERFDAEPPLQEDQGILIFRRRAGNRRLGDVG
jgi:hypothetical protein